MRIFANCILKARLGGEINLFKSCVRASVGRLAGKRTVPENEEYQGIATKKSPLFFSS